MVLGGGVSARRKMTNFSDSSERVRLMVDGLQSLENEDNRSLVVNFSTVACRK